jgi:hypothetical protein
LQFGRWSLVERPSVLTLLDRSRLGTRGKVAEWLTSESVCCCRYDGDVRDVDVDVDEAVDDGDKSVDAGVENESACIQWYWGAFPSSKSSRESILYIKVGSVT